MSNQKKQRGSKAGNRTDSPVPSLLEPESRGGDENERGISFQAGVVLSYVARWLAIEGFTSMLREGLGDAEAKFYVPGRGYKKEFVEVKNHQVKPAEFWKEIDRFQQMEAGSPGEFQWFTLASAGVSGGLQPLRHGLRRLRDPYGFYQADSPIISNSYQRYITIVEGLGRTGDDADFLYNKVLIESDLSTNLEHPRAMFKQILPDNHPEYENLQSRTLDAIYDTLGTFVQSRRHKLTRRDELEAKLQQGIPESERGVLPPVRVHTGITHEEDQQSRREIYFSWAEFFGGEERTYPEPQLWNDRLLRELKETKRWILDARTTRRIRLSGNRRLSASVALGSVFSAVAGFSIETVDRNGLIWATDTHPDGNTPLYQITGSPLSKSKGEPLQRVAISIGILRDISEEVDNYLANQGLAELPKMHLRGDAPIESPQQANLAVRELKKYITDAVSQTEAQQIDLFLAGPAQLAIFLGHRLNATAEVMCYERVTANKYVPTCRIS
jgi:hypothetical protein